MAARPYTAAFARAHLLVVDHVVGGEARTCDAVRITASAGDAALRILGPQRVIEKILLPDRPLQLRGIGHADGVRIASHALRRELHRLGGGRQGVA